MLRRLVTTVPGVLAAALLVVAPVPASPAAKNVPVCEDVSVENSAKAATAVFSGMVSDQERQARTDGLPGAIYLQTVTITRVYRGEIVTETVQVQTDRNQTACSLGALEVDRDYMFFVSGSGEPWVASGTSGTRPENTKVDTEVAELLGEGRPPVAPPPEHAVLTAVDTSEPRSLSRLAAPGGALVIVGVLGLLVVGAVRRRLR